MDDTFCERVEPLTPLSQRRADEDRSVSRMQRLFPGKVRDLCHMHLSFILDFSDHKLEDMLSDGEHVASKKKLHLGQVFKHKDKSSHGLFGASLTENGVSLMMPLIAFLRKEDNIKKEGLFRKPGNGRKMKQLKEQLILEGADIVIDPDQYGPHDVACVLKEFLRELPEPLLTYKHMEAHRQIRDLGAHARTSEEKERYFQKKLKAIQFLVRLMPVAAQKMVRYLMKLLNKVAAESESKMTAETLGTIFAPICFMSRKASASDMCEVVCETESSVAFMIEHSRKLFEVPKELVIDVVQFWKDQENYSPSPNRDSDGSGGMKRYPSGPIVNTNVCYIDRKASNQEDTASNTQAEVASLLAHIQSLPDTPHNLKLKKQIQKGSITPIASCQSQRRRSKSIGSSIRKRLPSLHRTRHKDTEFSILGSANVSECLSLTPVMTDLLNSPRTTRDTAEATRESRSRQKRPRHKMGENAPPAQDTPSKRERRANSLDHLRFSPKENVSPSQNFLPSHMNRHNSCSLLSPRTNILSPSNSINILSPYSHKSKSSPSPSHKRRSILSQHESKENLLSPVLRQNKLSWNQCNTPTKLLGKCMGVNCSNTSLPSDSLNTSIKIIKGPASRQSSTANIENEITYVPYNGSSNVLTVTTPEGNNLSRDDVPLRRCGPGTPIMRRAVMPSSQITFETTI